MNVFVTGTGRCGTVTFSKACRHIANYASGHETMAGKVVIGRLEYPDRHIEVDPHLGWMIGSVVEKYPDAFFVHLQRRKEEVVESWFRRGIQAHSGTAPMIDVIYQTVSGRLSPNQYRAALGLLYDAVNANIRAALRCVRAMHLWLHEAKQTFGKFWKEIRVEGDFQAACAAFDRRFNASNR